MQQKIVYFAPVEWGSIKQRPQQLAERLRRFFQFCYVQPLGLRSAKFSDLSRIALRLKTFFAKKNSLQNLNIKNPIFIPLNYKFLRQINLWLLKRQMSNIIDQQTIVWVAAPSAYILALLQSIKHKVLVYEMLDDYSAIHSEIKDEITATELQLFKMASLVIATSGALYEKARNIDPTKRVSLVSNGVDYRLFGETNFNTPAELVNMKPIIGYVGSIDKWMDFALIDYISDQRKDLDFVFIGPEKVASLNRKPNLHFIGVVDHARLPQYLNSFAVCIIPFCSGDFADTINPVKLYEYFALGKPVVANQMKELAPYARLIYLASNREEFLLMLEKALSEGEDSSLRAGRQDVAMSNDWNAKAEHIEGLLSGF